MIQCLNFFIKNKSLPAVANILNTLKLGLLQKLQLSFRYLKSVSSYFK